jgi:probable addiction module antidote protein
MKEVKTRPWDTAERLRTGQERTDFLDACFAEGRDDPAFIAHALGIIARARGMTGVARDAGMTREGLYKALSGDTLVDLQHASDKRRDVLSYVAAGVALASVVAALFAAHLS